MLGIDLSRVDDRIARALQAHDVRPWAEEVVIQEPVECRVVVGQRANGLFAVVPLPFGGYIDGHVDVPAVETAADLLRHLQCFN